MWIRRKNEEGDPGQNTAKTLVGFYSLRSDDIYSCASSAQSGRADVLQ